MNRRTDNDRERELYEAYQRGDGSGNSGGEREAFEFYQRLHSGLASSPIPAIDRRAVVSQMAREFSLMESEKPVVLSFWSWIFSPVKLCAGFALLLVIMLGVLTWDRRPAFSPVSSVTLEPVAKGEPAKLPLLWERRLSHGKRVTVPDDVSVNITLADGSLLTCGPGTQIELDQRNPRQLAFYYGDLTVETQPLEGERMSVRTPYGKVNVVGTVFKLRLR